MATDLRPLRLVPPLPTTSVMALLTKAHEKQHYMPHLNNLLNLCSLAGFFTISISLLLAPPSCNVTSSATAPEDFTAANGKLRILLLIASLLFLSNVLDTLLLYLLLVPLSDTDPVRGLRGKVVKVGLWIIGINTAVSFVLIAATIGLALDPFGTTVQGKVMTGLATTLFGITLSTLFLVGLKTRGPKFDPGRDLRRRGDESASGEGKVPPTPGTRDEKEKKEREANKVKDLGIRISWVLIGGWVLKGMSVLSREYILT